MIYSLTSQYHNSVISTCICLLLLQYSRSRGVVSMRMGGAMSCGGVAERRVRQRFYSSMTGEMMCAVLLSVVNSYTAHHTIQLQNTNKYSSLEQKTLWNQQNPFVSINMVKITSSHSHKVACLTKFLLECQKQSIS